MEEVSLSDALLSLSITSVTASLSPSLPLATDLAALLEFLHILSWVPDSEDEADEDVLMAEIDKVVAAAEIDEVVAGAETKLVVAAEIDEAVVGAEIDEAVAGAKTSDGKDALDHEEWRRRRGIGIPCSRCGLIHGE
jgi:hypothetical protein